MLVAAFLIQVVLKTIAFFSLLLVVRVLLGWLPNLPWENPFLAALSSITDPYLNLFRCFIPSIAGIDLSPIPAFLILSLSSRLLSGLAIPLLDNASYARYTVG